MPSRFETQLADEWSRCYSEFKETVIRRAAGDASKTEEVSAIVNLDSGGGAGGLVEDERGRMIQADGELEIAATQATTPDDTWVIRGRVYKAMGGPVSEDSASKTLSLVRREGIIDRKPRVRR
jgi:hypothetical protein